MKLSVIVPVYNKEQTIAEIVEWICAVDIGAIDKEIIIANDGSSDGTRRVNGIRLRCVGFDFEPESRNDGGLLRLRCSWRAGAARNSAEGVKGKCSNRRNLVALSGN